MIIEICNWKSKEKILDKYTRPGIQRLPLAIFIQMVSDTDGHLLLLYLETSYKLWPVVLHSLSQKSRVHGNDYSTCKTPKYVYISYSERFYMHLSFGRNSSVKNYIWLYQVSFNAMDRFFFTHNLVSPLLNIFFNPKLPVLLFNLP